MLSKIKIDRFPAIFPPRPAGAINPHSLSRYPGYIAQYKYDDIRILIFFHPNGRIELLNRKREPLLSYKLDRPMTASLDSLKLARGQHHLLDGGLMRHPMPRTGIRPIVLWDILIHNDGYLLGTSYAERYAELERICDRPARRETESGGEIGLSVAPGLWLAPTFRRGFNQKFADALTVKHLEGLILKNPRGELDWGVRDENNGSWQVRVRKQNGRHVF